MEYFNKYTSDPFDRFGYRVSYSKKIANNYRWAREMADYYDAFYSPAFIKDERSKMKMNYDLYNGRNPTLDDYKGFTNSFNYGNDAMYTNGIQHFDQIEHHPIIDQIAKAMVGERRRRKINAKVVDLSFNARNQRKQKKQELIKQLFEATVIDPLRNQIREQMLQGQQPTPEQAQEMQAQAERQLQTMLLEDIKEYMENDFHLSTDVQGQRMLDHWMKVNDIENITVEGFKHAIITGKEVYRRGIRNKKPYAEVVNPMHLSYYLSPSKNNIEDAEWIRYEEVITLGEFFEMFGSQVKPKDLKKLDTLIDGGFSDTGYSTSRRNFESHLVSVISSDPRVLRGEIDQRNTFGQEYLKNIYGSHAGSAGTKLRRVNICFKTQRMMYYVYRISEETGKPEYEYLDESYTPNKLNGDISWKTIWINQIWNVDKVGEGDSALYFNMGPLEGQYSSIDDPWNVKMPYIGGEYSKLMGNTKNVSVMDLGKPWQYKFNIQMARLQEIEATDLGKVLLLTQQAIPKEWDPIDFYGHLRQYKLGILDTQQEGATPYDANLIKGVDLSNSNEIANKIQYLEFLKDNIAKSMYYNPSRLGQISPYLPVTNNQQNILQSSAQTEDIYSIHNSILERLLNALIDDARICYYMNPKIYDYVLDEVSMASLDIDPEVMKYSKLNVFVANQSEDEINLQAVKEFIPFFVQSQMIGFEDTVNLIWAKNGSEALNIARKGDRKREQQAEQDRQMQQQMQESDQQFQALIWEKELQKEQMRQSGEHDVNNNMLNDKQDAIKEKAKHDAAEKAKDRALQEKLKLIDARLEEKKIEAMKQKNAFKSKS